MSLETEAGRRAFEAYRETVGAVTHDGKPMPGWDALSSHTQAGWTAAAGAARPPAANRWRPLAHAQRAGQPFAFIPEDDGTLSVESAVYQALGAASTCWEHLGGTGLFQSERAHEIGLRLIEFVRGVKPEVQVSGLPGQVDAATATRAAEEVEISVEPDRNAP